MSEREYKLIAGVMSGTSLDGIDVALVDVREDGKAPCAIRSFHFVPYGPDLKEKLLEACIGNLTMREILALDVDLGYVYAAAIAEAARKAGIEPDDIDAVGLHGQTVWHEPRRKPHGVTVQIGSGAVVAAELGCTVVNDFRSADVAAGGEGAPLVPFCDRMLLGSGELNRVALNVGGIANVTWLPAGGDMGNLIAFDTGPGNALIDAAMREFAGLDYDENGDVAGQGTPDHQTLAVLLDDPWFFEPPPKSTGRERFGEERGRGIAAECRSQGLGEADVLATLTRFTARTVADGIKRFAAKEMHVDEVIISGGGARNRTLIRMLEEEMPGTAVRRSDDYGVPADAKEALCFAILAHATLRGMPNNVPSVTGASRPVIGGAIHRGSLK